MFVLAVSIFRLFQVFKYISKYMQEGVAPHAPIIFVLGQLSISNMKAFFRISQNVFKYLLSILPVTKTDNMRKTYAISKINYFLTVMPAVQAV